MHEDLVKMFWGVIARIIGLFVPVRKKTWVFGSDFGNSYREGTKYLFEYMLTFHPDYESVFVTRSRKVLSDLTESGLPCVNNYSLRGVLATARAECVFTSQATLDVFYAFKKRGRRFFYIVHGQPLKVAQLALAKTDYRKKHNYDKYNSLIGGIRFKIKAILHTWLLCDHGNSCSEFVSATSEFLKQWMEKDFDYMTPVKVLGMPRNDSLFQPGRMAKEQWVGGLNGKFVVSYMPTHRLYGRGALSPTPFKEMPEAQMWMKDNGVVLLVKNHPNMLMQFNHGEYHPYESDCIRDITATSIDPMTVVYHSDVLVTDYSSVWMDYLLMRRPLIFYIYDDFEHNDVGVHYDVKKEGVGSFCYSEYEFFQLLKRIKANYDGMRPPDEVVNKFHKYVDGNSCERYFNEIAKGVVND